MSLKLAILQSGRTQRAIAKASRLDETRLSRLVRQPTRPSPKEIAVLSRVLGCEPTALFPEATR